MNWKLIGELIRLRYKLMWSKTRSRGGKIALFATGYLLFVLVAALLAAGGFGAGVVAIQSGRAERVAQIVLSGLFINAVFATVLMGFGMTAVFSDVELRRYPVYARERFVARHFLGIVDPFWFLILALEMGLVLGLYIYGTFSLWSGAAAVLLLFLCSYLLTRAVGSWIDRLMARRSGSAVLLMVVLVLSVLPGTMMPVLARHREWLPAVLTVLSFAPTFGAAAAMTHSGGGLWYGLGIVAGWMLALAALLVAMEQRPAERQQAIRQSGSLWSSPFDRIAAVFGPRTAPLVGHWLRFYLRNPRFRMLYLFSLPLAAFITMSRKIGGNLFIGALGSLALVSFLGTSRIAVNQFGYGGGALRRFFLFPTDPAASLRAGSYAAVLLGAFLIPPAAILWAFFAPRPLDVRMVLMPAINAVTVLFVFNGIALWTTLYGPRRGNYDKALGNDLSLFGNIAVIGTAVTCVFLPGLLRSTAPWAVAPENWWLTLPPAAFAMVFYGASLRGTSAAFSGRREALLAVVEGKA